MPGQERKRNPRALFVQGERLCTRCSLDVSQGHSWCSRWRTAASLRGAVTEGWWSFARSEGSAGGVPAFHKVIKINLRLILVSGKTKEFLFSPNDSAADIAKHVYDNWPMDWEEEQVSSPNILRLIYQGRFLHGNVTLGALKLPFGKTTVMHLVARETLPEPNSQGQRNREKTGESNCCVIL
uniref:Ubiquitin-like protein 3 n=1 Tax=Meleagris gallopavo TaxID=9103 RepID=A0A803Y5P2_MELGA